MGLFQSDDRGQSWRDMEVGRFSPLTYGRDVRVSPQDPRMLYACLSPAARSQDGSLYRSLDLGQSWARFDHGVKAETTMMAVALNPRDPNQVFCTSRTARSSGRWTAARAGKSIGCPRPCRTSTPSRAARAMIRAHLLRWRPRPAALERSRLMPRARASGRRLAAGPFSSL